MTGGILGQSGIRRHRPPQRRHVLVRFILPTTPQSRTGAPPFPCASTTPGRSRRHAPARWYATRVSWAMRQRPARSRYNQPDEGDRARLCSSGADGGWLPRPGSASPNSSARQWVAARARERLAHLLGATAGGRHGQARPRPPRRRDGGWPPRLGSTTPNSLARQRVATRARQRLPHLLGATVGGRHGQASPGPPPRRDGGWPPRLGGASPTSSVLLLYLVVLGHLHACLGCLQILFGLSFLILLCLVSDT
jgi:hypothetical protein